MSISWNGRILWDQSEPYLRERTSMTPSRGATHWSGEIWHMMMPVLRQGWVVKQNMMWWWYFVAMLYRNIIKPSKHLQGGILTVTYCTFWIDIINKYYTFAQTDRIENKSSAAHRTGTGLKCLSKYDVIKLPPPTSTLNDDTVGKEGWGGENVS